ncbi:ScbA/BarX family gamma-butyrolactone biosynthesis protein [Streptomyces morookaense]|uniref:A-factor biosynthesis hotdog domain-containing protein n=1 Tax=Streptomyces morookaense TaxID=1970 RepID=A0A7Y7E7R0_STRMO|nr:ScbA/BarX family gamma-butyrolactone biosynthesis protein [Streptomyces morookaense]NVK79215.1 hypothetical protein [Streptomyces morookaense]
MSSSATGTMSTVPRAFVHKTAESEVLLTGWRPAGPGAFVVTARWPVTHDFYGPRHGLHDPLLLAESVRQTVPLLSHAAFDVPFGDRQSWSDLRFALDPAALAAGPGPAEVELRIACSDVVRRSGRLVSVAMDVDVVRAGVRLGRARTGFANHRPAVYRRLRGRYANLAEAVSRTVPLAPPTAPCRAGRERFADVVLSPTHARDVHQLRIDLFHPALFDHLVDHAPGMLLLEAARQAAHAAAYPQRIVPVAMDVTFTAYAELDAPCWILTDRLPADRAGRRRVLVSAVQNEACVFSSVVTLERI